MTKPNKELHSKLNVDLSASNSAKNLESLQTRYIFEQLPAFILVSAISGLFTFVLFWNSADVNRQFLQIWFTVFMGHMLLRSMVLFRINRSENEFSNGRNLRHLVTLSAAVTGALWATAAIVFNPTPFATPNAAAYYDFIKLGLFGTLFASQGIAALACYTAHIPSFLLFICTSILPTIVYFSIQPNDASRLSALIGVLLIIFLIFTHRGIYKTTISTLKLRLHNENLINFLKESNIQSESINKQLALEIYDRKNVEARLQEANENLEHKVAERTNALVVLNSELRQNQERLSLAINASDIGLWDWQVSNDHIIHINFEKPLGYVEGELNGFMGHLKPLVHPDDYGMVKRAIVSHFSKRTTSYHVKYRMRHKLGHWIWVEDNGRVVEWDETGHALRMIGTRQDISSDREIEEKMRLSSFVFMHSQEAIFILDKDFRFIAVNPGFSSITGYAQHDILNLRLDTEFNSTFASSKAAYPEIIAASKTYGAWEGEYLEYRKSGESFVAWLRINAVNDNQGKITHYLGLLSDITARREAEEKARYLANYDKLTGLANRSLMRDRLHACISRGRDTNARIGIIHIDLDRFRQINDTLGHEIGDELLCKAAKRISSVYPDANTVSRVGGDEFILITDANMDQSQLTTLCERFVDELRRPFRVATHELLLGASIGVAIFPDNGRELQVLLNHADTAMHQAKRLGGNSIHFYTTDLHVPSIDQLNLETNLRRAIFRDEFVVHYQPKLDIKSNKIVGVEALVRWAHPTMGLLSPKDFIPIAEETGLITAISELVLDKAARQVNAWKEMGLGDIRTSVNIPAQQLRKGNFLDVIHRIIANTGVNPKLLELELTESALMDDSANTLNTLKTISQMGITISLDDFGTGYSSLSYLKRFPIDILKIDQAFIRDLGTNSDDEAITRAIITMAHAMGMLVVAEGVETEEHLSFLRAEGCDYIQGFLLSKPIPNEDINIFLSKRA